MFLCCLSDRDHSWLLKATHIPCPVAPSSVLKAGCCQSSPLPPQTLLVPFRLPFPSHLSHQPALLPSSAAKGSRQYLEPTRLSKKISLFRSLLICT